MTKILNFGLKIKGDGREGGTREVLRPCHPPKKFETCTYSKWGGGGDSALLQIVFFITSVRDAAEPRILVTFPKI